MVVTESEKKLVKKKIIGRSCSCMNTNVFSGVLVYFTLTGNAFNKSKWICNCGGWARPHCLAWLLERSRDRGFDLFTIWRSFQTGVQSDVLGSDSRGVFACSYSLRFAIIWKLKWCNVYRDQRDITTFDSPLDHVIYVASNMCVWPNFVMYNCAQSCICPLSKEKSKGKIRISKTMPQKYGKTARFKQKLS